VIGQVSFGFLDAEFPSLPHIALLLQFLVRAQSGFPPSTPTVLAGDEVANKGSAATGPSGAREKGAGGSQSAAVVRGLGGPAARLVISPTLEGLFPAKLGFFFTRLRLTVHCSGSSLKALIV
jgi:hypothetical protein